MIRFLLDDKTPRMEDVFSIDWAPHLGQDTLTGVPNAVVRESSTVIDDVANDTTTTTKFWIRAGAQGEVCRAMVQVSTAGGRELDAEIIFGIR